jgi:DNA-binding NarL/FixJ family response regulator
MLYAPNGQTTLTSGPGLENAGDVAGRKRTCKQLDNANDLLDFFKDAGMGEPFAHGRPGMKNVTILIADDHAVVRHGLRALLETQPGWKIVAAARTGKEALEKALELRPDVAILDVGMPVLNGLDAATLILKALPSTRIVFLTMHAAEELIEKTVKAGARGYVLKSDAERDLIAAVDAILQDKTFFTPAATEVIMDSFRRPRDKKPLRTGRLSVRERQIVQLLAEGKANKEVASELNIAVRTVEGHRAKVMAKLRLRSFSDLVRYAVRNKIVEP